jgi:hypothetical protein
MMILPFKQLKPSGLFSLSVLFFFILLAYLPIYAQEKPPRPIAIYIYQNLSFGAFSEGSVGGTVTLTPYGVRYTTGDLVLFTQGWPYFPAIFEIEANPGTVVHFLPGSDATLTGNNGGSLLLHLGSYIPIDPIIITTSPPSRTQVLMGGTLTVSTPMANPIGSYTGTFSVMFIQE